MAKTTMILGLLLLSLTSKSQIRQGDNVIMPIEVYRNYRKTILICDTLKQDCDKIQSSCDSLLAVQDTLLQTKDLIISNLHQKVRYKDEIIKVLSKPNKTPKIHYQAWIGGLIGAIATMLILR